MSPRWRVGLPFLHADLAPTRTGLTAIDACPVSSRIQYPLVVFPGRSLSGAVTSKPDGAGRQSAIQILHGLVQPPLGIFFGFPVKYQKRVIDVRVMPALLLEPVEQAR